MRALPIWMLALAGCPESVDCDLMAAASVQLDLQGDDGAPISGADVTYSTVDSHGDCDEMVNGAYVCGWEVAGAVTIHAAAMGFADGELSVEVEQGDCHVVTRSETLVLGPVDCTDEEVPSVRADVAHGDGSVVDGVVVDWTTAEAPDAWAACEGSGTEWTCGSEVAGDLLVRATAPGHEDEQVAVTVGHDECHVITELVDIDMVWLPD